MPKKNLSINKFEKGILNRYDKRDIPEGGLHSLVDSVSDIEGSVRQMGSSIDHTNVKLAFSLSEKINSRDLIEDILGQSKLFFK